MPGQSGHYTKEADAVAAVHPRVTLQSGTDRVGNVYEFVPSEYPAAMIEARKKYQHLERIPAIV